MSDHALLVALPFLALALGAFGTFTGTGGGFLFVPALLFLYPDEAPEAIVTISLTAVLANVLSGSLAYGRLRRIDYRSVLLMAVSMVPGAILGALTTTVLSRSLFQLVFGAVFIALALYLFLLPRQTGLAGAERTSSGSRSVTDVAGATFVYNVRRGASIGLAFGVGFLGGMLGIGGGSILVSSMVGFLGFPIQVAAGTSQLSLVLSTLSAVGTHLSHVSFQDIWLRALLLVLGAVVGGQLGARLSFRSTPRIAVRLLILAMVIVGFRLVMTAL